MQAYLIDPEARTVTEVEFDGKNETIYDLIDCHTFQVIYLDDDPVYVDDNGKFKVQHHWFWLGSFREPLCGRGLVTGQDQDGDTSDRPKTSIEDLTKAIRFVTAKEAGYSPALPAFNQRRKV